MEWKTLSGKVETLENVLEKHQGADWDIFIGTDSQTKGRKTKFITAFAILNKNHEGSIIHRVSYDNNIRNLRDQLIQETWLSIELAQKVSEMVDQNITIHLDVNSNPKFRSGKFKNEITGFVKGFGYDFELKPNSWCASALADSKTR
jgi:predicted RNase H-related nuclease YkuK (DUF458 family)